MIFIIHEGSAHVRGIHKSFTAQVAKYQNFTRPCSACWATTNITHDEQTDDCVFIFSQLSPGVTLTPEGGTLPIHVIAYFRWNYVRRTCLRRSRAGANTILSAGRLWRPASARTAGRLSLSGWIAAGSRHCRIRRRRTAFRRAVQLAHGLTTAVKTAASNGVEMFKPPVGGRSPQGRQAETVLSPSGSRCGRGTTTPVALTLSSTPC